MVNKEFSFKVVSHYKKARLGKIKKGDGPNGSVKNPDKIISLKSM